MNYIQRFPFIISSIMAIVIGFISYKGADYLKDTCVKMTIGLIIFYMLGIVARRIFTDIYEELDRKRKEELEKEEMEREESMKADESEINISDTKETPDLSLHNMDFKAEE
ncbi:MAG: hypothetical protein Q8942_00015 [Bacillota bacterium]|nr:hypothetical protein [Bacillota bacterium]